MDEVVESVVLLNLEPGKVSCGFGLFWIIAFSACVGWLSVLLHVRLAEQQVTRDSID